MLVSRYPVRFPTVVYVLSRSVYSYLLTMPAFLIHRRLATLGYVLAATIYQSMAFLILWLPMLESLNGCSFSRASGELRSVWDGLERLQHGRRSYHIYPILHPREGYLRRRQIHFDLLCVHVACSLCRKLLDNSRSHRNANRPYALLHD